MKYKVGDKVFVTAREPMPGSMRQALMYPQVIKEAQHPFYAFKKGWSVNVERGDKLFPYRGK